ncbi:MAG: FTR1 family protein [Chloroflexi bacterium]|nr:FTR1 family protein [Chloroflexota bacterium]
MIAALVITAREAFEASLLIGIILAYLARSNNRRHFRDVWLGVGLALLASFLLAAAIILTMGNMSGRAEELFEGAMMLLAAAVLTYVLLWLRRERGRLRETIQSQVQTALGMGSGRAIVSVAFLAVFREGAEAALYLSAIAAVEPGVRTFAGAGVGLGLALMAGYLVYRGSRFLKLSTFLKLTELVLLLFAAGLVGRATLALQSGGLLPGTISLWDSSGFLPDSSVGGVVLGTLLGYTAIPSLLQAMFYLGYMALVLSLFVDLGGKPRLGMYEEPFTPLGKDYAHPLYRLLRKPWLTILVPSLMGLALIFLLLVAVARVDIGPFNNEDLLRWGPFQSGENENSVFNLVMWIVWLPLLSLVTVLLGRVWCGVLCPLRLATDGARGLAERLRGKGTPTAPYVRLGWLLPTTFILITFFVKLWPVQRVALYGAFLFLAILGVAVLVGLAFRRGTWCRYICPVGGWLARITRLSPLGLRPNLSVCATCQDKPCLRGTAYAGRCPAYLNPSRLESNRYCTKCWNCVVNCPPEKASLRLGWRFPGTELLRPYAPDLWESLYVASLMGMYMAVGHRSLGLAQLPFPLLFFGLIAGATAVFLALCLVVTPIAGLSFFRSVATIGYIFLPLEFSAAILAFGDDALEFFNIVTPAAALLLAVGFVWSVVLAVSILRNQARTASRALLASVPVGATLLLVLFLWLSWYASGTVVDLT